MATATHTATRQGEPNGPVITPFSNTIDAGLLCNVCCEVGLLNLCRELAPISNFWTDCSGDEMAPLRPVIVPIANEGAAAITVADPADFEQGDTTVNKITVTPVHITRPFHITTNDWQKGFRLEMLAAANASALAKGIWDKILPLLTVGNFPAVSTKKVSEWPALGLPDVYGLLKCDPKNLILDPSLAAKVLFPTQGGCCAIQGITSGFGFSSISQQTYWTTAPAGTLGFGFCRQAIIVVSGVPQMSMCTDQVQSQNIPLPGLSGLTVQFNTWCDAKTRTRWGSYDVILGVAAGVGCAGVRIVPAAEV